MKHKHLFSLLDQSFTTVHVTFDAAYEVIDYEVEVRDDGRGVSQRQAKRPNIHFANGPRLYVYKVPKAWDVREGDRALVFSPKGMLTVVHVVKVDSQPDIDIDADFDYKWLVQKIDTTEHDRLVDNERNFHDHMLEVERVKQRESLINSFRDSLPEGSQARALFEQTTGTLLTAPAVEQPPEFPMSGSGQAGQTLGNS